VKGLFLVSIIIVFYLPVLAQDSIKETLSLTVIDGYSNDPIEEARVDVFRDSQFLTTGTTDASGVVFFTLDVSATFTENTVTEQESLFPAYPNPFQGVSSIPFSTNRYSEVTALLYDLLGREAARRRYNLGAGSHEIRVDLSGSMTGTYFLQLWREKTVIGTATLVHLGSGSGRASPALTLFSGGESHPFEACLAGKTASLYSNEYSIRVQKEGYEKSIHFLELPRDLDYKVRLLVGETTTVGMRLIRIPAGTFDMGSDTGNTFMRPTHPVTLTNDYFIAKYEVTQEDYAAVTGINPSNHTGQDGLPVERVTWYHAVHFANDLSILEGFSPCYDFDGNVLDTGGNPYGCEGYRLPTEAEWEYAARAGSTTAYSFGDVVENLDDYAWYRENAGTLTHRVGEKRPNPWGLYDMHGNVWEWVYDWFGATYYSKSPVSDPVGPSWGSSRVMRGGSWQNIPEYLLSAYRFEHGPSFGCTHIGFRLVRTAQ